MDICIGMMRLIEHIHLRSNMGLDHKHSKFLIEFGHIELELVLVEQLGLDHMMVVGEQLGQFVELLGCMMELVVVVGQLGQFVELLGCMMELVVVVEQLGQFVELLGCMMELVVVVEQLGLDHMMVVVGQLGQFVELLGCMIDHMNLVIS